ncbi:MAG: helix-turn-helix transcriptional regulator [Actinomycetota bacterium]
MAAPRPTRRSPVGFSVVRASAEPPPADVGQDAEPERATDADGTADHDADLRLRHVIGDTLRTERLQQGRTLADVADEAAVSLPYLSEIERGRKEVSSDVLHAIHHALGLELDDVLERAVERLRVGTVAPVEPIRTIRPQGLGSPRMLAA